MLRKLLPAAAALACLIAPLAASAAEKAELRDVDFSFEGPFGKYDRAALQRGYKVYAEVCSSCHAMHLMSYRNLAQKGGPFYDEKYKNPSDSPYAKAIASAIEVPDIDQDTGDAVTRKATPADRFKSPFANEIAARASNGGALPPDLSVIAKAREGGPQYIYSLLTGYKPAPAGLTMAPGQFYNTAYHSDLTSAWKGPKDKVPAGGVLAMSFQLTPDRVAFDDGTKSTTDQEAKDVATFLAWAAEPHAEERKEAGFGVMIYLLIFAGITYLSYRKIWKNIAH